MTRLHRGGSRQRQRPRRQQREIDSKRSTQPLRSAYKGIGDYKVELEFALVDLLLRSLRRNVPIGATLLELMQL